MNYRIRYTNKNDYSDELIVEADDVRAAIKVATEQLPEHIVILSALQANL